jgi:predicted phage terminase large subunit-like protein
MATGIKELRPQPAQERFLKSTADVCIFGGSAGGGKTWSLLLEPSYHLSNGKFRSVCFRRTVPMIKQPGGLWDVSETVYLPLGGVANQSALEWKFPSGALVKFAGMELESDRFGWQGSQIALLMFDELSEFEESQFWFLLSRNRSTCGVRPYVRGTTNPRPDGWLRNLLDWWIGPDGFAIPERCGRLRWFCRLGEDLHWADSKTELVEQFGPECGAKNLTFIRAKITDNPALLKSDPNYLSTLRSLPLVERRRLLDGDWNATPSAGSFFRREWFPVVEGRQPSQSRVRFWDRAATEQRAGIDPDATAGVLLSRDGNGIFYVEDVQRCWATAAKVEALMIKCAAGDPKGTMIAFHQDPGSAGKGEAQSVSKALAQHDVRFHVATGDKQTRARPCSAQAEAGHVRLLRGPWNEAFLKELVLFPDARHDDQVDAFSGAFEILARYGFLGTGEHRSWSTADQEDANSDADADAETENWQPRTVDGLWRSRKTADL